MIATFSLLLSAHIASTYAQTCDEALLPFQNLLTGSEGSTTFDCFSCTPLPLSLDFVPGSPRCEDGDIDEFNITVSCTSDCQDMIDTVKSSCANEEDFNIFEETRASTLFFFKWGLCDFGYKPTACDQALADYFRNSIDDFVNGDICARKSGVDVPDTCPSVCQSEIENVLTTCKGQEFILRREGSEVLLKKGEIYQFNSTDPGVQDATIGFLNEPCLEVALSLIADPQVEEEDDPKGTDPAIIGAAVGVPVLLLLVGAVVYLYVKNKKQNAGDTSESIYPAKPAV